MLKPKVCHFKLCFLHFQLFHLGNLKPLFLFVLVVFGSFLACRDFYLFIFFLCFCPLIFFIIIGHFLGQSLVYSETCVGQVSFIPLCVVTVQRSVPNLKHSNSSVQPQSQHKLCAWCINISLNSLQCDASLINQGKASKTRTGTSRGGAAPKGWPPSPHPLPGSVSMYSMPFYYRRMYVLI